ncbi:MAG: hypothetical protein AAGK23_10780 [Pseudomonadota bacterium]
MQLLISTWRDGLYVMGGDKIEHELAGRGVRGLTAAGDGSVIAILDNTAISRRSRDGTWNELIRSDIDLSVCLISQGEVFVGTDVNAAMMRLVDSRLEAVKSFDHVVGRESWYGGTAIIDGKVVGPPLGVRSMTAACDGSAIFANVHVGGIPRSTDQGASWHPTINIEADVHEVVCSNTHISVVAAASAVGLCLSHDAGESWQIETKGLHEPHCLAAVFIGDEIFVSASEHPFSEKGAVYRRSLDGSEPFAPVDGGFPRWTSGVVDTACMTASGANAAIIDQAGNVYVSSDAGSNWSHKTSGLTGVSAALFT